jgi:Tol biopolymer transport system component
VAGDHCPAVSPDGKTLAFRRLNAAGNWGGNIYLVGLDKDFNPHGQPRLIHLEPRPVTSDQFFRWSCVSWTADSQRLVFFYDLGLWTLPVSAEGGDDVHRQAILAVETGSGVKFADTSRTSSRLVYALSSGGIESIWRMRLAGSRERTERPQRMFASTKGEFAQQYSPNGMKVAFESVREGNLEIWVCGSEGQECAQLTSMGSPATGVPTWSPDGKQIAFYSNVHGNPQIFAIPAEGGPTRQITSQRAGATFPRWSRDGKWIYFSSKEPQPETPHPTPYGGSVDDPNANEVLISKTLEEILNGGFEAVSFTDPFDAQRATEQRLPIFLSAMFPCQD